MLAVKFASRVNAATQSGRDSYCVHNGRAIGRGQSPRVRQAHGADVSVGHRRKRVVNTTAEHLALGFEFHVNLQADNRDESKHCVSLRLDGMGGRGGRDRRSLGAVE